MFMGQDDSTRARLDFGVGPERQMECLLASGIGCRVLKEGTPDLR